MVRAPCQLKTENNDRSVRIQFRSGMDPHKTFSTGLPAVTDDFIRSLIALVVGPLQKEGFHVFRNGNEQIEAEPVDPVRDRLSRERNTAPYEIRFHPLRRHTLHDLLVHDLGDQ